MTTVSRYSTTSGDDPFGKAEAEATEKGKSEFEEVVAKWTTKIDNAAGKSASLEDEVEEVQAQLAALAKQQAEVDKIRFGSHADYEQAKADLEVGLSGVRMNIW